MTKETKIPYSKIKITLALVGSFCFVTLGILTLLDENGFSTLMFPSETLNKGVSVLGILFFGTIALALPYKLSSNKFGLEINERGIIDNSNLSSVGLVEWKDIKEIRVQSFNTTSWLLVYTYYPKKYIEKAQSRFKKWRLNSNVKSYGTPIYITSTVLNVNFTELEKLVMEAFENKKTHYNNR